MNKINERKLKNEYRAVELEILSHNKGRWPCFYYLRHILCFLRKHHSLCIQNDYKELYNETIVLLILHAQAKGLWTKSEPADQQSCIEVLADLENKNIDGRFEFFSIETVNEYLAYRKKRWANGEKYTKEQYGFIS